MNPLLQLYLHGQSYWLDNLTRDMIRNGELARRVRDDGLRGVTSNPAIFHKAIANGEGYDEGIKALSREGLSIRDIYERLVVSDIQGACDILRPVYEWSHGVDGYVSLEVSPYLAHDTEGSLREARHLHRAVDRPNVFIKIPGTPAGVPAIEQALFEGININITLLFSIQSYEAVAEAYLNALERRVTEGLPVTVASVASLFLSRIDVLVDQLLGHRIRPEVTTGNEPRPEQLLGKAAIANAKLAYQRFRDILATDRWKALAARGARPQRMLWASTSTKDPLYHDLMYVAPLIGPDTVNTMPDDTIRAFADHGTAAPTIEDEIDESRVIMQQLREVGPDFDVVTAQLQSDGVQRFIDPFDALMATLAERRQASLEGRLPSQRVQPGTLGEVVKNGLQALDSRQFGRRLFAKDPLLWSANLEEGDTIRQRLGWLASPEVFQSRVGEIAAFAADVRDAGFRHVVLLGMGGSSLCPTVCRETFGAAEGWPDLLVLDDIHPRAVKDTVDRIDLSKALFIVASKSGTTTETLSLYRYFFERVRELVGGEPGDRFVAITDPGTPLVTEGKARGFRRVFENPADIGGRYSALSYFGLVPMALLGVDIEGLLDRALAMQRSCGPFIPAADNPGVHLGALLGLGARHRRDKVTFLFSRSVHAFGAWSEQLLAESTGKNGRGVVPIDGEPRGSAEMYGTDRIFVGIRLAGDENEQMDRFLDAREEEDHPVVRIALNDRLELGAEFFRWEIATAVAGSILGINAFDEPNVAESKRYTRELLGRWERDGALDEGHAAARDGQIDVYCAPGQSWRSQDATASPEQLLHEFFAAVGPGDYLALLAYVHRTPDVHEALTSFRFWLRDETRVPTTLGYGPRYLHSTGQLHKGGSRSGRFLMVTSDPDLDVSIPGATYTFGTLHRAQALGDYRALIDAGRRVLRVHLARDVDRGLRDLGARIQSAVATQLSSVP